MLVPSHQDSVFLYTDPPSAVGFWFALEDCTTTNGCLSFVPGSHKSSPITKRFVRMDGGTGFISIDEDFKEPQENEFKIEECSAGNYPGGFDLIVGTLVVIHGNVVHKSEANRSLNSRYIYTFHVIEGASKYDEKNW
jgi:phytanoyl-CoA hydroxylase